MDDDIRPIVEFSFAEFTQYTDEPSAHFVSKADDWTINAVDRLPSATRQFREMDYPFTTQSGIEWWGSMAASGFGAKLPAPLGNGNPTETTVFDGTQTVVTIPAVDPDSVRVEAGMVASGSFADRPKVDGLYRDFVSAARLFHGDSEDADFFSEEGYAWERLDDDGDYAASLPSFKAYWE
jgi:hypothetical protein